MIGQLRHKVTIEEDSGTTRNAYNEITPNWTTITGGEVFADVVPLNGRELIDAQQQQADVTHRVRIRYLSTVTPTMRVVHGSRNLHITSVINQEERDRWMELLCVERI